MGGPYKMCDQCDGPGTRCKRCPLEDEANDEGPVRSEPVVGQDELDELRKDKARLDWLETQACWIGVSGEYDITPDSAAGGGYSVTVRAVCDLAIRKADQ